MITHSRCSFLNALAKTVELLFLLLAFAFTPVQSASADPQKFKLGFILTTTGVWAEYGQAQRNAAELAKADAPALFKDIDFIFEDCGHQSALVLSAYRKLRFVDHADLIFVWGVLPVEVVAPAAEADRQPLLASAQVASAARGRRFVIRTINYSEQVSLKLLQYLRSVGAKKIGLVQAQMSYYDLLTEGLKKNLAEGETLTLVEHVAPDALDFQSISSKLKHGKFDMLGLFLTPAQILALLKRNAEQGVSLPLFGMHAMQSHSLIEQAGGLLEGAVYAHSVVTEEFRERYVKTYKNDYQLPWAANTYDMTMLTGRLFANELASRTTPIEPEAIVEKFSTVKEVEGAGGRFIFRDLPETGKFFEYPLAIYRISGSEHKMITK